MTKGAHRLRPSDLAQMKYVALGLLPDDLDDMMVTQDDVLDIAEELKEMQEDLTSGQVENIFNFTDGFWHCFFIFNYVFYTVYSYFLN